MNLTKVEIGVFTSMFSEDGRSLRLTPGVSDLADARDHDGGDGGGQEGNHDGGDGGGQEGNHDGGDGVSIFAECEVANEGSSENHVLGLSGLLSKRAALIGRSRTTTRRS
jgi:hypothetical protein